MLSDKEIHDIADQMNITCLQGCFYKDKLKYERFQPNKGYIINLHNLSTELHENFCSTNFVLDC